MLSNIHSLRLLLTLQVGLDPKFRTCIQYTRAHSVSSSSAHLTMVLAKPEFLESSKILHPCRFLKEYFTPNPTWWTRCKKSLRYCKISPINLPLWWPISVYTSSGSNKRRIWSTPKTTSLKSPALLQYYITRNAQALQQIIEKCVGSAIAKTKVSGQLLLLWKDTI